MKENGLTVTTNADSGAGSLREALTTANAGAGNVDIYFSLPEDQRLITCAVGVAGT